MIKSIRVFWKTAITFTDYRHARVTMIFIGTAFFLSGCSTMNYPDDWPFPDTWAPRKTESPYGCPDISGTYAHLGDKLEVVERAEPAASQKAQPIFNQIDPGEEDGLESNTGKPIKTRTVPCRGRSRCYLSRVMHPLILPDIPHNKVNLDQNENGTIKMDLIQGNEITYSYTLDSDVWSCNPVAHKRTVALGPGLKRGVG